VETLKIKGMLGNHRLARAIQDSGWSQFLAILKHKAESAGIRIFLK
jgi:putative transposase